MLIAEIQQHSNAKLKTVQQLNDTSDNKLHRDVGSHGLLNFNISCESCLGDLGQSLAPDCSTDAPRIWEQHLQIWVHSSVQLILCPLQEHS